MNKTERLDLFKSNIRESNGVSDSNKARDLLSLTLNTIENIHCPTGEQKMSVPEISDKRVQNYGERGLYLPLISHKILISENGAFRIFDLRTKTIFLEKENVVNELFVEIPNWQPKQVW